MVALPAPQLVDSADAGIVAATAVASDCHTENQANTMINNGPLGPNNYKSYIGTNVSPHLHQATRDARS